MAPNVIIKCVKDDIVAKETPSSGAIKSTKKVDKKDDHCVDKYCVDLNEKDSQLLPCLIVYSLIQKREVAHCLSVFIIVIIYFDNFDMIL